MIEKRCKECNKIFTGHKNKLYCNSKCRQKFYERKKTGIRICILCQKELEYGKRRMKFCEDCYDKYRKIYTDFQKLKRQIYFEKYKIDRGCDLCGYNKCPDCLDFHHLYNKKFEFRASDIYSYLVNGNKRVKNELDKCILICKNCHYSDHYKKRKKKLKEKLINLSKNNEKIIKLINHYDNGLFLKYFNKQADILSFGGRE